MGHLGTRHSRTETKRTADVCLLSHARPEVYSIERDGIQSPHFFVNPFFFLSLLKTVVAEDNS